MVGGTMRTHAVETAAALYEAGTLTLEQAANQAGLPADEMAARVRPKDVAGEDLDAGETRVLAD